MATSTFTQSFSRSNSPQCFSPNRERTRTDRNPDSLLHHKRISKSTSINSSQAKTLNSVTRQNDISLTRTFRSYIDFGFMKEALSLFESVKNPDTFLWNVMIRGYTNNGLYKEAIDFYYRMQFEGVKPDNFTYPFVIKSCSGLSSLIEGLKVHSKLMKIGLDSDLIVCNSLIVMYGKVGCIELAEKVFEEMTIKDLVSWNSLISGYLSVRDELKLFLCFREMQEVGLRPDRFGIINALKGCSLANYERLGKEIHCHVIRCGFELDLMVQTSLIDMYCKCGNVDTAEMVFDRISCRNIVVYNAMIGGHAVNGDPLKALACLLKMQEVENLNPDATTMVNVLPSCAQLRNLLVGKSIHGFAIRNGVLPHLVLDTSLVDMYGKCGEPKLAECIFYRMRKKSLVSWNAMLAAYVQNGWNQKAIDLVLDLHDKGTPRLDAITISSILPAYAELATLRDGMQIHSYIAKLGYKSNSFISNSIIDMYAKCGDLQTAREVFDRVLSKDVVSWNTIIMAYAIHGCGKIALELFSKMQEERIEPNASTFVSILSSCSISGLVDEGWKYFNSIKTDYGIDPGIEHYGCMVDLLGRTGNLYEARNFIQEMPLVPTARIWGSLLAASRNQGNLELAEQVAEQIFSLEHDNTGCYVLLCNMYAQAGRWEDVEKLRCLMARKGLEKTIANSMVELNSKTCRFINGDKSHMESNMIYDVLDIILRQIEETMYVPSFPKFRPPELIRKRSNLPITHSVRLAISFGLINTEVGSPILVKKNVRICEDCHTTIKTISQVTEREVIVGNSRIYHHFRDGRCSCGDY